MPPQGDAPPMVMVALPVALLFTTTLLMATAGGQPVTFTINIALPPGNPTRVEFDRDYGVNYAMEMMRKASLKVWEVVHICHPEANLTNVNVTITDHLASGAYAQAYGDKVEIDMKKLLAFDDCARSWFQAVLYHETTHLWQGFTYSPDDPKFDKQNGLQEGTAEYVVMAGTDFYNENCAYWRPSVNDSWYQGYCWTAHFLRYLTPRRPTLVGDINRQLTLYGYQNSLFPTLLGDTPENLWKEFANNFTPYVPGEHPGSRSDGIIPAWKSLCRAP